MLTTTETNFIGSSLISMIVLWALIIIGWVANTVKLIAFFMQEGLHSIEFGVIEALRFIGIFLAPLGAIMGYL